MTEHFFIETLMKRKFLVTLLIFVFVGCQRLPERPDGMPELTPCMISVTFGGERLSGVGVTLQPKDSTTNRWLAGGQTDADGRAVLKTAAHYKGVVPGEYSVMFQKFAEPELGKDGMPLPAKPLIPLKYSVGKTLEQITVTKDKAEYSFVLDGLEATR